LNCQVEEQGSREVLVLQGGIRADTGPEGKKGVWGLDSTEKEKLLAVLGNPTRKGVGTGPPCVKKQESLRNRTS